MSVAHPNAIATGAGAIPREARALSFGFSKEEGEMPKVRNQNQGFVVSVTKLVRSQQEWGTSSEHAIVCEKFPVN